MIKRLLLSAVIFIIIIATAILSLAILIDPNHFRAEILEKVRDKTGYQLNIKGELRWHIWPQLSILTDTVILSDEGANKPILTADNMRLDVELLPLFSKNLVVSDVFIRSSIINLTEESKGIVSKDDERPSTATINQIKQTTSQDRSDIQNRRWSFLLNKLRIADATIVLQKNSDFFTFRNLDITVIKEAEKIASVMLSGNINRNQQDIDYQLSGTFDLNQFPQKIMITLAKLDYAYSGIEVPTGKLVGSVSGKFTYQPKIKRVNGEDLKFTINNNAFWGSFNTQFDDKSNTELTLNSDNLDLTSFLSKQTRLKTNDDKQWQQIPPVIANSKQITNELAFLNRFDATLLLNLQKLRVNQLELNNVKLNATNQLGITELRNVSFDVIGLTDTIGRVTAKGQADGSQQIMSLKLNTNSHNIELGQVLNQMGINNNLQGLFNIRGDVSTSTLIPEKIFESLNGQFSISSDQVKFNDFSIAGLIQNAVYQYAKTHLSFSDQQNQTALTKLTADVNLHHGLMQLSALKAELSPLALTGDGDIDLIEQNLDINLKVDVTNHFSEDNASNQSKPLSVLMHLYGEFEKLRYQIELDKSLKEHLGSKLQNKLEQLRERFKNKSYK